MKRGPVFISCLLVIFGLILGAIPGEIGLTAAPLVPVCQIQGSGLTSPRVGQAVRTQGVVSADFDAASAKGFFIQTENCDANPATSDGVFVYLGERLDVVSVGDLVEVSGTVVEYYGFTEINVAPTGVQVLAQGQALPAAVELYPPFDDTQSRMYFESLEAMLVAVSLARVVGPTDGQEDTWVVRSDLGLPRVFQDDPAGIGEIICVGSDGNYEIQPAAKVGDQVQGLRGVLEFSLGTYRLWLLTAPTLIPAQNPLQEAEETPELGFTFGTFNLESLFDVVDDPEKDDDVLTSTEYHRKLEKLALAIHDGLGEPAFVGVQEAENAIVLNHLLAREEIEADYGVVWVDGPDTRGIDVALLYRHDQVTVLGYEQRQGCTALLDGLGPDGDRNVTDPHNAITCDTNGDGLLDGNRLFSRPPLVVELQVDLGEGTALPVWVLVNHFKSKREDSSTQAYTLPRRLQQAQFVAGLVSEIFAAHPGAAVIVLGDLNDYPNAQPLAILRQARLWNAMESVARASRYTYIYQGVSQVMDHVLVSSALAINWVAAQPAHLNADYPYIYRGQTGIVYRGSDHDPVGVQYRILPNRIYLPLVAR